MENNVFHPSKRVWLKVVFNAELTIEQKIERQMKIRHQLLVDRKPIVGISTRHTEVMNFIRPTHIDFLVVDCRGDEEGAESGCLEVLVQYWDDIEEHPELTSGDVAFTFLAWGGDLQYVNYATMCSRGLVNTTTVW